MRSPPIFFIFLSSQYYYYYTSYTTLINYGATMKYMQWQPHHAWAPPCSVTLEAPTNSLLTVYSL